MVGLAFVLLDMVTKRPPGPPSAKDLGATVLTGQVEDPNGRPISNATLRIRASSGQVWEMRTENKGEFAIPNLPGGDYNVWIDGYPASVNGATYGAAFQVPVALVDPVTVTAPTEPCRGSLSLSGRLVDAATGTLPGAFVSVQGQRTGCVQAAISDWRGEFRFSFLPADSYEVRAELQGFKSASFVRDLQKSARVDDIRLEIVTSLVFNIRDESPYIRTRPGDVSVELSVFSTDCTPNSGQKVTLINEQTGSSTPASCSRLQCDASVPPGVYSIVATGTKSEARREHFVVNEGINRWSLKLDAPSSIRSASPPAVLVQPTDATGCPLTDATAMLRARDGAAISGRHSQDGIEFDSVPLDSYELEVSSKDAGARLEAVNVERNVQLRWRPILAKTVRAVRTSSGWRLLAQPSPGIDDP